jgi:hypothetical protein
MTIREAYRYLAQLEDCTLPRAKWTHEMHLTTGLYIVLSYGKQALPEMKKRIWRYNEVMGKGNDGTGYHDTLTVFWLWAVRQFILKNNIIEFNENALNLLLSNAALKNRKMAEDYYEEIDLIFSRRRFMHPPLQEMAGVDYFLEDD